MATINKAELIKEVADSTDLNKTQSDQAIDAVFSAIQNALAKGEKVQLIGFGSFEVRNRAARKGRNPQTGAEIDIPATKIPAFKPGNFYYRIVHTTFIMKVVFFCIQNSEHSSFVLAK